MKATHKTQIAWIESLILSWGNENNCNGFELVANDVRAASYPNASAQANAEHYLRGCGLPGFPFANDDQEKQLAEWGYKPTAKMIDNFFTVSAGLLVESLRNHGQRI